MKKFRLVRSFFAQMVFEYILRKNGLDPQKDLTIDQSIDFGYTAAALFLFILRLLSIFISGLLFLGMYTLLHFHILWLCF